MKLLLNDEMPLVSKEGYETIHAFQEFVICFDEHKKDLEEIRIQSFMLGLACLYWIADYSKDLPPVKIVIDLKDKAKVNVLKDLVSRHL